MMMIISFDEDRGVGDNYDEGEDDDGCVHPLRSTPPQITTTPPPLTSSIITANAIVPRDRSPQSSPQQSPPQQSSPQQSSPQHSTQSSSTTTPTTATTTTTTDPTIALPPTNTPQTRCEDFGYDVADIEEHNQCHKRFQIQRTKSGLHFSSYSGNDDYFKYRCWTCCLKFQTNDDLANHFEADVCTRGAQYRDTQVSLRSEVCCLRCVNELSKFSKPTEHHNSAHERFDSTTEKVFECRECCMAWLQRVSLIGHWKRGECQLGLDYINDPKTEIKSRNPIPSIGGNSTSQKSSTTRKKSSTSGSTVETEDSRDC